MADETPPTALDRIDRAIARIDAGMAARARDQEAFARRHETLRARMADAIAALDGILSKGDA